MEDISEKYFVQVRSFLLRRNIYMVLNAYRYYGADLLPSIIDHVNTRQL